jgi:hypothetical protein
MTAILPIIVTKPRCPINKTAGFSHLHSVQTSGNVKSFDESKKAGSLFMNRERFDPPWPEPLAPKKEIFVGQERILRN